MPIASSPARFGFAHRRREAVVQHLVALGLSGLLLMLAFPRPGWGFLAYVALVPAGIAAARTHHWPTLFWAASMVWLAWWSWMLLWLLPISPAAPFVIGVYLGLNAGLALLIAGALHQKLRWPMVLALPLGWVGIEALRTVWPAGGFAWFTLAHSQARWEVGDVGRVIQVADLMGQHTVGLVVAVVNGAAVDVLLSRRVPRKSVGLAATLFVAAWSYGQWRIGQFESVTRPGPRIAVVQTDLTQDNQAGPPSLEQQVEEFAALSILHQQAAQSAGGTGGSGSDSGGGGGERVALVVWPETVVPAPLNEQGAAEMRRLAADPGMSDYGRAWYGLKSEYPAAVSEQVRVGATATIVGASSLVTEPEPRRGNAAYFYDEAGVRAPVYYDKQHLVPAGEYMPGPAFLESMVEMVAPWDSDYTLTPGDGPVVFTLPGGFRVATPICYEDASAGVCRRMVYSGGEKRLDALVNLTNNGWYPGVAMRRQHAQLASIRCIENRVPMARSVNTGISTFIDSLGRCTARLEPFEAGTLAHTVRVDSRHTLYAALGGWPWVLFVAFALGAGLFAALFGRPIAKHRIA